MNEYKRARGYGEASAQDIETISECGKKGKKTFMISGKETGREQRR